MTVREWAARKRETYLGVRERSKKLQTKIRYGIRATEMARVVNYIDAHPDKATVRRSGEAELVPWDSPHECLYPACPRCGEFGLPEERAERRREAKP